MINRKKVGLNTDLDARNRNQLLATFKISDAPVTPGTLVLNPWITVEVKKGTARRNLAAMKNRLIDMPTRIDMGNKLGRAFAFYPVHPGTLRMPITLQ